MKVPTSLRGLLVAILLSFSTLGLANAESEFSEAKLQAFVTAAISVTEIIEQWSPRIEDAESQEAADELLAQANAELEAAIEEPGEITVEEYKDISQAAQGDPALSARIEDILRQRLGQ